MRIGGFFLCVPSCPLWLRPFHGGGHAEHRALIKVPAQYLQANGQATKLIEEAHAAAGRVQDQETQKAIAAAEQILAKSREAASQEHARMLTDLKREVGQLVVQAATRLTGRILTKADQRRMAEDTIERLTPAA